MPKHKYRYIESQLWMWYIQFCRNMHCLLHKHKPIDGTCSIWCECGKEYPKPPMYYGN